MLEMKWMLLIALFSNCIKNGTAVSVNKTAGNKTIHTHLTLNHTIGDIVNHAAFQGFGELLLPWENNSSYYYTSLRNVCSLMPYHGNVRPDIVLSAVNHMIDEVSSGKTIFYNFYSDQQKQQNP